MELSIEKIVYPGKSLGRHAGKVIFTDEGLPGERVAVEIHKEKKNFAAALTRRVLSPSAQRVTPRCDHYRICGSYQYIAYPEQLRIKQQQLQESLRNTLPAGYIIPAVEPSMPEWGYRNKLQVQILHQPDGTCATAYHKPQTRRQMVPFDTCELASPRLNRLLAQIRALIERSRALHVNELLLRESRSAGTCLAVLRGPRAVKHSTLVRGLEQLQHGENLGGGLFQVIPGRRITSLCGEQDFGEIIAGREMRCGAGSFLQSNIALLERLIEFLRSVLPLQNAGRLIDLYAGIGTFGLCLGEQAAAQVFVESDPENVVYLKQNITRARFKRARLCAGRAEHILPRINMPASDIVIVDPPRGGLDPQVCRHLCRRPVRALAYISCDPMTLARDLTLLRPAYHIRHIKAFDFFAQTPHIETCCVLCPG